MVDAYDLIDFDLKPDKTCIVKYKLAFGDSPAESSYIVRTLNPAETSELVARLSRFIDNYTKG